MISAHTIEIAEASLHPGTSAKLRLNAAGSAANTTDMPRPNFGRILRAGVPKLGNRSAAFVGVNKLTTGDSVEAGHVFRAPQSMSGLGRLFDNGRTLNPGVALRRALKVAALRPEFPEWSRAPSPAAVPNRPAFLTKGCDP